MHLGAPLREQFSDFLRDVDGHWGGPAATLHLLGSTALFLRTPYQRGTKDGDVLRTRDLDEGGHSKRLLDIAGPDSALYQKHRMYLDLVSRNIPMLPPEPLWHVYDIDGLEHLEVRVLDVADVCVSKLKRWTADDRDDVEAMIDLGHFDHARVVERLREVIEVYWHEYPDHLQRMVGRFSELERDWFLGVTKFRLPTAR